MAKLTKKQKEAVGKIDKSKLYSVQEASQLVKDITNVKFDASVDLAVRLGVDPRKANQMVRGVVTLPHGTGKDVKVLALVTPDKEAEAKEAGADYVGLDEYLQKIKDGWTDVDVIITMPSVMGKLGPLGRVLGPRGLMPNPKLGSVTDDLKKAVKNAKSGQVEFKNDKDGNIGLTIGKKNFSDEQLLKNYNAIIETLEKEKSNNNFDSANIQIDKSQFSSNRLQDKKRDAIELKDSEDDKPKKKSKGGKPSKQEIVDEDAMNEATLPLTI